MLTTMRSQARRVVQRGLGPQLLSRLPRRTDLPLEAFGLRIGETGTLHIGSNDLAALVERFGSPLHVVHGERLDDAADAALAPHRDPDRHGCDIYYSYKTNPVQSVLARLHARGIGSEVISEYELWLAIRLGVPGERIIYNGPYKSPPSIRTAVEHDVRAINANSIGDVARIALTAGDVGRPARLGLRVALPGGWGGQFGIASRLDVIGPVVRDALADPRLRLEALHVHRGGTLRSRDDVAGHVSQIVEFVESLRDATGWSPSLVDVGGSLACPTVAGFDRVQFRLNRLLGSDLLPPDPADAITLAEASELAAGIVAEAAQRRGEPVPDVVMEPGRALTANSQLLLTSVVDAKTDVDPHHAIVDAGINLAETVTSEYHQLLSASAPAAAHDRTYRLAGPICTPADVLYNNWRLPDLAPGHVLAIMDAGAYFVPFSTAFSFPRPAVVVCDADRVRPARARETFDDLVRLDSSAERPS